MSLWNFATLKQPTTKPLPKGFRNFIFRFPSERKGIPLCALLKNIKQNLSLKLKASYTVEAAIIIPLVVGFWVSIMLFFRILQVQTGVSEAINYAGRMTAVESSTVNSTTALKLSAKGFFMSEIREHGTVDRYVKGGKLGISLLKSKVSDDYIELIAEYKVKLPINFLGIRYFSLEQHSYHRKWNGKQIQNEENQYVYYTDNGQVYHLSCACNYLDLSIHTAYYSQISGLRNRNGHRYSACSCRAENITDSSVVYITDYGQRYHSNLHCRGLKRTIHMVKLSDVGNRRLCSKCNQSSHQ